MVIDKNLIGLWFFGIDDGSDWMGSLSRREDGRLVLDYRFRYGRAEDSPWLFKDKKNWYTMLLNEKTSLERALEISRSLAKLLSTAAKYKHRLPQGITAENETLVLKEIADLVLNDTGEGAPTVDEILVHDGDLDRFCKEVGAMPWAHVKVVEAPAVHIVKAGQSFCHLPGAPKDWPKEHKWVAPQDARFATCEICLLVHADRQATRRREEAAHN